jgi:peptidoglycan lytic transglycosylase
VIFSSPHESRKQSPLPFSESRITKKSETELSQRERLYFVPKNCAANSMLLAATFLLSVLFISGCGARNPVADRRQPAPTQPMETPSRTEEAAKKATDTSGANAGSASNSNGSTTGGNSKRKKDAAVPPPVNYMEEGNASWYGVPFNGRRASNGEIYDMYKMTAAHRTLPFETMVKVTNLNNGKTAVVRITDRGPFVDNRVIDLSMAAAKEIESIGPGVVPVRLEILTPGIDPTAGFFTVQVGAFRDKANAERLRDKLSATYTPIFIQTYDAPDGAFYRVRVGKISGEQAAQQYGEQLRVREGFDPKVVRLDENSGAGGTP